MDEVRQIVIEIETLKQAKKFEQAIALLENGLLRYSDDYRLYEELADIHLYSGSLEKSIKAVDFALTLNPKSATGNYLKGFIFLSQDKITDAVRYLEISNKMMGNNAEVLRNLWWAYTMLGETTRGITILKRALNIAPGDMLITEDLAMALIGAGDVQQGNVLLKRIWKKKSPKVDI